jgi:hypothetical protein
MKKKGNRLTDMEFDEVSLVTRPANQLSKVVLFKSDEVAEETEVAEDEVTEVDADDESVEETVTKGKMKKRKAVPAMDDEEEMDAEEGDMEDDMEEEKPMTKGKKKMSKTDDNDTIEIPQEVYDYIDALEHANSELVDTISKLTDEADEQDEEILKSADPRLVEIVKGLEDRAAAAEAIAKAERDHRLEQEYIAKAGELSHLSVNAAEFGTVLKNMADVLDADDFAAVWQVLSAANANVSKSGMFTELGKAAANDSNNTMSVIEKAAAALRQNNPTMTREQSIAKAVEADANLYNLYIREGK